MEELFGAPMSVIAAVLAVMFIVVFAVLLYIFVRNPLLVRMAARNIPRRKAQTALVIAGLMMATVTISSAFTTGDSVTASIEQVATEDLRNLDQLVTVHDDDLDGLVPVAEDIDERLVTEVVPLLNADPAIDGVAPILFEDVAVVNLDDRLFEISAVLTGLDPQAARAFDPLETVDGQVVDLGALAPDEVYIDRDGAEEISVEAGDLVGIPVGPGQIRQFSVKAIAEAHYVKQVEHRVVLMTSLAHAQEVTGKEGLISAIMVSNLGEGDEGIGLTAEIQERLADHPLLRENGLELTPLKQDFIEFANLVGSLFVTFFSLFGLFSICVGILLIFLIFQMLAAERKPEMGMSRAIGMRRSQLVQMFIAEGAIYSIGSAIVGTLIGAGIGALLVIGTSAAFAQASPSGDITLTPTITLRSLLVSFFLGSIVTFITVGFASLRVSRLNIVRAIRDLPEPERARGGVGRLVWGTILALVGFLLLFSGYNAGQTTPFLLGGALLPMGVAFVLRFFGVSQRLLMTILGLWLIVFYLPLRHPWFTERLRDDWQIDFSIFIISSFVLVAGAIMVIMNNTAYVQAGASWLAGRFLGLAPVIKSAVAYPLRNGFRTGLSITMFAVVILSVTSVSVINNSFGGIIENQQRLAGGYDVVGAALGDLNPIRDVAPIVEADPELDFVVRDTEGPAVGVFRTIGDAEAKLPAQADDAYGATLITAVDPDFVRTNDFRITLATAEFRTGDGFDAEAVWRALEERPGVAVINAQQVPTRANFGFNVAEGFSLEDVEGLFVENEVMDPVPVTILDLDSARTFEVTVIGVIDGIASDPAFFLPPGMYASTEFLSERVGREIDVSMVWFETVPGTENADQRIESAFFEYALQSIDIQEAIDNSQAANSSFNTLLMAFMGLGLVVGIAGLGVISARAVIERRQQIGVLRAIGFSKGRVQLSFLLESSFIAIIGIGLGIVLSLLQNIIVIGPAIQANEPDFAVSIPWLRVALIAIIAYVFTFATTLLPSRQAANVPPAEALRYE